MSLLGGVSKCAVFFQREVHVPTSCIACLTRKMYEASVSQSSARRAAHRLDLVHSDIVGPIKYPAGAELAICSPSPNTTLGRPLVIL